jgi:putative transposase
MNLEQKRSRTVSALCSLLGYSRQAFYQQKKAAEKQSLQNELIIQQVLLIRSRQKRIGTRKLLILLKPFLSQHHILMGRDTLFKLLAENQLLIRRRKRKIPRTTFSDHWYKKYPNLIVGLPIQSPDKLWVSDITYITLKESFAYLSLITDAYSRMIVGYHLHKNLEATGCVHALKMAIRRLQQGAHLIHHSDRGCQYCSTEYVEQLTGHDISISMTEHSDPRENAIAERINGIIKQEFLSASYDHFNQAKEEIQNAIQIYNTERPHSSINMLTPLQAHTMTGELKRHWKNYYISQKKEKEVHMT